MIILLLRSRSFKAWFPLIISPNSLADSEASLLLLTWHTRRDLLNFMALARGMPPSSASLLLLRRTSFRDSHWLKHSMKAFPICSFPFMSLAFRYSFSKLLSFFTAIRTYEAPSAPILLNSSPSAKRFYFVAIIFPNSSIPSSSIWLLYRYNSRSSVLAESASEMALSPLLPIEFPSSDNLDSCTLSLSAVVAKCVAP